MRSRASRGFAIIEVLIALTILSIALLGIVSGVSSGIVAISGNRNMTRAMIIAKSRLNEFMLYNMRGADIQNEPVKEYPGFTFSRKVARCEHELFGSLNAKCMEITIGWNERNNRKNYTINYMYSEK